MHLKNFSLLQNPAVGWSLSPAYDLVSTALVLPDDLEETALPVAGKKAKLRRQEWLSLAASLGVPAKVLDGLWKRLAARSSVVEDLVARSGLSGMAQQQFVETWKSRVALGTGQTP